MTKRNQHQQRRSSRRIWVYSQLNHEATPEQVARVLVFAGLEQARLEAEAKREAQQQESDSNDQ